MEANAGISVNRKFKDGLFRFVFGQNKSNLLSLYNALNGTSYDRNEKLKDDCRTLKEYCMFVEEVRSGISAGQALYDAVSAAVDKCIEEGVLEEFLSRHRREVREMCLTEFNEEKYKEVIYKDGYEDGKASGRLRAIFEIYRDGLLSASDAAKKVSLAEDEFLAKYNEWQREVNR